MFFTPYFGGCKYTNKFLFINKIIVFQHFDLLITILHPDAALKKSDRPPLTPNHIGLCICGLPGAVSIFRHFGEQRWTCMSILAAFWGAPLPFSGKNGHNGTKITAISIQDDMFLCKFATDFIHFARDVADGRRAGTRKG